jgi:hypothetical protein
MHPGKIKFPIEKMAVSGLSPNTYYLTTVGLAYSAKEK